MTAARMLEQERGTHRAAFSALTSGEHGLVSDFADLHGFPWDDYADVFDDLAILNGCEPSFHEVVRALLGRHVSVLREGMVGVTAAVDLRDLVDLGTWIDRCLAHFLPLDRTLPSEGWSAGPRH
ncbi:hypothetical protein [Nocardioides sp.]|uniref:hypothetical protein n=1 Tax=Nocardioides sp. TaxID=35761 RepID=UPI00286C9A52|nr:hypothetical protein [Nocardioides sp.]